MSSELRELYQQVIIDHAKNPRNFRVLENANYQGEGFNPLCGDKVRVYATVEDHVVKEISFQGTGCAISTASASLMTQCLKGKSETEVEAFFKSFHDLVTGKAPSDGVDLEKLAVFGGVCEFPSRVKCASLCWHTLRNALIGSGKVTKTE